MIMIGLDAGPRFVSQLVSFGDVASADIVKTIAEVIVSKTP